MVRFRQQTRPRRGQARVDSDLDLCVVRPDALAADDDEWREQLQRLSERVGRWTGNDARILELAARDLGGVGPLVEELDRDGILLIGDARLFRRAIRQRGAV